MNWSRVRTLYAREMRAALRDRSIVVNSVVLPLVLYPFILWVMFTGIAFVRGQTEQFLSRVAVAAWPQGQPALRTDFEQEPGMQARPLAGDAGRARESVRSGDLDALVEFLPSPPIEGNLQVRVTYNGSKERSVAAKDRIQTIVDRYRGRWLEEKARALGIADRDWRVFTLERHDVATGSEVGSMLLGLMLPILFVIMVAVGCLHPAVDATAGERERGTWETLLSLAATRREIVVAKYLYVATMGGVAGILNVTAMALTMKPVLAPLLAMGEHPIDFAIPAPAIPLLVLGALLLSGFAAGGMMIFASFARTFKEGQAAITPFYLLFIIPVMFLQVPGLELTGPLALIPIINVTMLVREAISGTYRLVPILVTIAASMVVIGLCLRFAAFLLQHEDFVIGSYSGNIKSFVRSRLLRRERT